MDGSPGAFHALDHARGAASLHDSPLRASETQAQLAVQHAINYPEVPEDAPTDGFLQGVKTHLKRPASSPRVRYPLDARDPATRILERAKTDASGLTVLGAHGKGMVERLVAGSFSRRVARETEAE